LTVVGAEDDGTPHLPPNVVFARRLQDDGLADRKHRSGQIARHPVFRRLDNSVPQARDEAGRLQG
jgi:hypothetical protein